jgi:hypothetical protein
MTYLTSTCLSRKGQPPRTGQDIASSAHHEGATQPAQLAEAGP